MRHKWLNEVARDLIAFGSIPFLILTIARVSVLSAYYPMQFIISSTIFFVLRAIFRGDLHVGIGFILLLFVSLYYGSLLFAIFALFVYIGIIFSSFYLNRDRKEILRGILLGGISAGMGYLIVRSIFF